MVIRLKKTLLVACSFVSLSAGAMELKPYVSAFGGIDFASESDIFGYNKAGMVRDIDVEYKSAFVYGLSFGVSFYQSQYGSLSSEFEYSGRHLKTDSLSLNHVDRELNSSEDNELNIDSYMVNLIYETPYLLDKFRFSIGAGVGVAHLNYDINYLVNNAQVPTKININDKATPFAYQFMLGATYDINDNLSLLSNLKYFSVNDHDVDRFKRNNGPGLKSILNSKYENSWTLTAGIRYTF